jgi:phosphoglycerate dehydrogenase-like enzyme
MVVPPVLLSDVQLTQDPLKIVTTYRFEAHEIAKIKAAGGAVPVEVTICTSAAEMREKVKDAEVVYGDLDAETLAAAPRLKWIQSREAGMERMDVAVRPAAWWSPLPAHVCARHHRNRHGAALMPHLWHKPALYAAVL